MGVSTDTSDIVRETSLRYVYLKVRSGKGVEHREGTLGAEQMGPVSAVEAAIERK